MSTIVPFRLRVGKDNDLRSAFDAIPVHIERSDIIREALRMYFFNDPTPIRDNMEYFSKVRNNFDQSLSKVKVKPLEVKVIEPKHKHVQPQQDEPLVTISANSVVSSKELEDAFNKSLGL